MIKQWMIDLANKHGLDPDTVRIFYNHTFYNPTRRGRHADCLSYIINPRERRRRVEQFFDLYFEGRDS